MMNTYFFKILEFIGKPIELMVVWVVVPMLEILILLMGLGTNWVRWHSSV